MEDVDVTITADTITIDGDVTIDGQLEVNEEYKPEPYQGNAQEGFIPKGTADQQLWQLLRFMGMLGYELDYNFFNQGRYRFVNVHDKVAVSILSFNNAVALYKTDEEDWESYAEGKYFVSKVLPWFTCSAYKFNCAMAGKIFERVKLAYSDKKHQLVCLNDNVKFTEPVYYELWKRQKL